MGRFSPRFAAALASSDVDEAWRLLSSAAAEFLGARSGVRSSRAGAAAPPIPRAAFAPRVGREGDALTLGLARCLRVLRVLEHALCAWPSGPGVLPRAAAAALAAARRPVPALGRPAWAQALAAVDVRHRTTKGAW